MELGNRINAAARLIMRRHNQTGDPTGRNKCSSSGEPKSQNSPKCSRKDATPWKTKGDVETGRITQPRQGSDVRVFQ